MSNIIHPSAVVHDSADLGHGVIIGPGVVICANTYIGDYCVIGGMPEHRGVWGPGWAERTKGVLIGPDCKLSNFVTVHAGVLAPTVINGGTSIHGHCHVAHDVVLGTSVTIGSHTTLAGHVVVMDNAFIAGQNAVHQWAVIGAYAILGAGGFLKGHIPPGEKWIGNPARPAGVNDVGLARAEMTFNEVSDKYQLEFEQLKLQSRLP